MKIGANQWRQRIDILIHGRADYLEKRDPTYWRSGDMHELLMQHCATRQVDAWDLTTHAPAAVRDFLRFLDETGRLHPGSTRVGTLNKELDRLTPKFAAAMTDESRWRLAKRVFTAMVADGVDMTDESQADRWAEKFSTLDADARRPVLGDLMDDEPGLGTGLMVVHDGQVAFLYPGPAACKHRVWADARCVCGECSGQGAYPAIQLPGERELAEAVAGYGSSLLCRILRFADWIGTRGRPVDKHGELTRDGVREAASVFGLTPTDATHLRELPGLSRVWRLSLEFGVLELHRTEVVPGPARDVVARALHSDARPDEALALWCGLYDEASAPFHLDGNDGEDELWEWMAFWPPHFFGHLLAQAPNGELVSFAEIMEGVLREQDDRIPPADRELFTEMAMFVARTALSYVADHGGVEVSGDAPLAAPSEEAAVALRSLGLEPWAFLPVPGLKVRLTDLGRYAMREQLLTAGAIVPLAEATMTLFDQISDEDRSADGWRDVKSAPGAGHPSTPASPGVLLPPSPRASRVRSAGIRARRARRR